jgi:hypothetical protein
VTAQVDDIPVDLDVEAVASLQAEFRRASLGTAIWCSVLVFTLSICVVISGSFIAGKPDGSGSAAEVGWNPWSRSSAISSRRAGSTSG